jgi:hypothetical protein
MVVLLNSPWQRKQVPLDICFVMLFPPFVFSFPLAYHINRSEEKQE